MDYIFAGTWGSPGQVKRQKQDTGGGQDQNNNKLTSPVTKANKDIHSEGKGQGKSVCYNEVNHALPLSR